MPREIDDPGGEYVSVQISVNGHVKFMRDAVLADTNPGGVRTYKVDDTDTFTVPGSTRNRDYYIDLAKKLMNDRGSRGQGGGQGGGQGNGRGR